MKGIAPFDFNKLKIACKDLQSFYISQIVKFDARVMKLVDMTDSKSVARNSVPVQVRPLVPFFAR